jgi:hypothetical protein
MSLWISWSRLRTHEECRQKGMLQRAKKQAPLRDVRNFFPGTVTDRVVRDWLNGEPEKNPHLMPDMVAAILDREEKLVPQEGGILKWRDKEDRDRILKECVEAVTKIEPLLNKYVLPYEYAVDVRFKAPMLAPHPNGTMEQVVINGAMDILVRDAVGRYAVWDVKHTRDDNYWKKTRGQLSFYDLAILLLEGEYTYFTGLLQPLCKKPDPGFRLGEDDRSQLMQRVLAMANDVWKEDFTPTKDTNACYWCDVKHACIKFKSAAAGTTKKFTLL